MLVPRILAAAIRVGEWRVSTDNYWSSCHCLKSPIVSPFSHSWPIVPSSVQWQCLPWVWYTSSSHNAPHISRIPLSNVSMRPTPGSVTTLANRRKWLVIAGLAHNLELQPWLMHSVAPRSLWIFCSLLFIFHENTVQQCSSQGKGSK